MKTVKLYYQDNMLSEFTATVIECIDKGDHYEIVLDKTAFFPEEGGQTADTGIIGDAEIFDAKEINGVIYHHTKTPLKTGITYNAKINFSERFDKMQNHSGEHIISGIVHKLYGYENVGFHLSDNTVTLDFNGVLTREDLNKIEILANETIHKNVKITATFPSDAELKTIPYRSKLDLTDNIRIVTIDGYDICACCAPHVSTTGEIGIIKLLDFSKHKNGVRINIKCGMRAILDYQNKYANIAEISAALCAKQEEAAAAVKALQAENDRLKYEITGLKREKAEIKLNMYDKTHDNILMFEKDMDAATLRYIADKGADICRVFTVFSETDGGYNFVCCSKKVDLKEILPKLKQTLNLSGGGNSTMLQGRITADKAAIEKFFNAEL